MSETIKTVDMHTAGEPLRIVVEGAPKPQGKTILEKRRWLSSNADWVRQLLMWEPRGHADMYGCYLVEPEREGSDFGAIFIHNEGYSTMCGHAILALARFAVDEGMANNANEIKIDVPAGQVIASWSTESASSFINVPSYAAGPHQKVTCTGIGDIQYQIAFGGAFYAFVEADQLGLNLSPEEFPELVRIGRFIKDEIRKAGEPQHPTEPDLSFLYGIIFTGKAHQLDHHSRHVCIFAEGELDRSPTGTGVSARAALLYEDGSLPLGKIITIESILGSTMDVEVVEASDGRVVPKVFGQAFYTGRHEFLVESDDPLRNGFLLR